MGKDFEVKITNPERAKDFMKVFGRTTVAVETPIPVLANLPGKGVVKIFKLDMSLITEDERKKLAEHISEKLHIPLKTVEAELARVGLPILEQDCTVVIHNPQRWF